MRVCVRVRACMHVLQFLHHVFTFSFLFCMEKIIMLHKPRYVKKMESERGEGAEKKKKKKGKKKRKEKKKRTEEAEFVEIVLPLF